MSGEKKSGLLSFFSSPLFFTILIVCLTAIVIHIHKEMVQLKSTVDDLRKSCSNGKHSRPRRDRSLSNADILKESGVEGLLAAAISDVVEQQLEEVLSCDSDDQECTLKPGPKGDQGEPGMRGELGPRGEKGNRGEIGPQGEKGQPGQAGEQGQKGGSGTKGDKGEIGLQGERGQGGPAGAKGDKGGPGAKGDRGDTGSQGQKGEVGFTGFKGEKGEIGVKGDQGKVGSPGSQGSKGDKGVTTLKQDQCEWKERRKEKIIFAVFEHTAITCPDGRYVAGHDTDPHRIYCCSP